MIDLIKIYQTIRGQLRTMGIKQSPDMWVCDDDQSVAFNLDVGESWVEQWAMVVVPIADMENWVNALTLATAVGLALGNEYKEKLDKLEDYEGNWSKNSIKTGG